MRWADVSVAVTTASYFHSEGLQPFAFCSHPVIFGADCVTFFLNDEYVCASVHVFYILWILSV